jgi:hypothetical protein
VTSDKGSLPKSRKGPADSCVCGHVRSNHRGATNRGGCAVTIWTYGSRGCSCSRFLDASSANGLAYLAEQEARAKRNAALDDEDR